VPVAGLSRAKPRTVFSPPVKNRSLAGRSVTVSTIGSPFSARIGLPASSSCVTCARSPGQPDAHRASETTRRRVAIVW
jgi:hypothetical protein